MPHEDARWSPSDDLLDRFLTERVAPDERAAVEAWLARMPAAQRTMQALRQLRFASPLSDGERWALWHRIEQRFVGISTPVVTGRWRREIAGESRGRKVWYAASAVALGLALFVTGGALWMRSKAAHAQRPPLAYSTAPGERANITLPDGSTVALSVASRLEVPVDYAAGDHTVRLTGEALFTVSHRDHTPFVVLAGKTAARVLGTSFVMRHYRTDTATVVAVRDGRVAVGPAVLTAHRLIEMRDDGTWQVGSADASQFSFATGALTLPEMTLAEAIPELDRWYNVDLQLGDSTLASRHIVGEFIAGSSVDLRTILEMTFGVRVVRAGRTLTLFSR